VTLAVLWLAFLVMFVLTVGAPTAAALWLRLRRDVPIRVFEISAGFYLLSLLVQFPVFGLTGNRAVLLGPLLAPLVAPAIYALSEESLRYLSFRAGWSMRGSRHDEGALMAGLGFGGMEALIFALILTWTVASVTFAPDSLRSKGIDATQTASGVIGSVATYSVSRLAAVACHLGFSTLCALPAVDRLPATRPGCTLRVQCQQLTIAGPGRALVGARRCGLGHGIRARGGLGAARRLAAAERPEAYSPRHCGFRLARKASTPSLKSCDM